MGFVPLQIPFGKPRVEPPPAMRTLDWGFTVIEAKVISVRGGCFLLVEDIYET